MVNATNAQKILSALKKEYPSAGYYLKFSEPLHFLVGAILSAQTRDENVTALAPKLFSKYKTAKDFANANLAELEKDISSITFFKNKAKNIKGACKILVEKYNGKVPRKVEELTELPGVGRKTANAVLTNAFDIVEGIIVDTHVIRLSQRLGLSKNKGPEKIEKDLMEIFLKNDWKKIPWVFKSHGRAVCKAPVPACSKCVLNELCPKIGVTKRF